MIYDARQITLKNGKSAILRSPDETDAADLISYLQITAAETDFLQCYPEERNMSLEQEETFLRNLMDDPNSVMILCRVDSKLAGNCNLNRFRFEKNRHRASIGVALFREYWGLGIGTAMLTALIDVAKQQGIEQLELEVMGDNTRAIPLYEKMGFRIAATHPNAYKRKDGVYVNAHIMIKSLSQNETSL